MKKKTKPTLRFIPDNPQTREEKVEFLLNTTWESLQSHLPYIHKEIKNFRVIQGGVKMTNVEFEKRCIKEYAKMIKIIAELF